MIVSEEKLKYLRENVNSDIVHLIPSMGNEIEKLYSETFDMVISCGLGCSGYHTCNIWFGTPSEKNDSSLADKDGNYWWPFIYCYDRPYSHSYDYLKHSHFTPRDILEEAYLKYHKNNKH